MAAKRLHFQTDARARILQGASTLADAVRVTLGPKARCVLLERRYGHPLASDDGVTIAKDVELEDPEENLGVQMLRQAAERARGQDPLKVVRLALENAVSVAGTLLMAEATLTEIRQKTPERPGGAEDV